MSTATELTEEAVETGLNVIRENAVKYASRWEKRILTREELKEHGRIERSPDTGDFNFVWKGRHLFAVNFRSGTLTEEID